jgi:anti-sigma B factor antagonist
MDSLTITQRREGGVVILDLAGKITIGGTNQQLRDIVRRLVAENEKSVVLNLAAATYVDSSGLGELVAAYSSLKKSDGRLKLAGVSDKIMDIMTITKLYTVFDIYDTETEAVKSFEESGETTEPKSKSAVEGHLA